MGAPLLVVGASAGRLLPKAGAWMDTVKAAFGVMMLGVAVWMLGRILPGAADAGAVGVLAFVSGYCLLTLGASGLGRAAVGRAPRPRRARALYGVLLLVGALAGRSDPLRPLEGVVGHAGGDGSARQQARLHAASRRWPTSTASSPLPAPPASP